MTALYYVLNVGNNVDIEQFIKEAQQLPELVRGEVMTAAEQLQAIGAEQGRKEGRMKGREEGREEVALNLLKEGAEPRFVEHISRLELATVLKLKAQLEKE